MLNKLKKPIRLTQYFVGLPGPAKKEMLHDLLAGLPADDPGAERIITEGLAWLGRAQDNTASGDDGVARHFSLLDGWSSSYPETTGYIVPTMIKGAELTGDDFLKRRARRMLDWLVSIQFAEGGFQGGLVDQEPVKPVTFNTGQILIGLAAGVRAFGDDYYEPMIRAAKWLVDTQDPDGCWRSQPTPFAEPGEKAYETHVAIGLFDAAKLEPDLGFQEAAWKNIYWALKQQRENGWFDKCCLIDPANPLTHTIGYVLRGLLEAYLFEPRQDILEHAVLTADGLLQSFDEESGFLPGRISSDWTEAEAEVCLTGTSQIASCWMILYRLTGKAKYRDAAYTANSFVRKTIKIDGQPEMRGGVKGSFPVYGSYGTFEFLNWACKFTIDANIMEMQFREQADSPIKSECQSNR